MSLFGKLVTKNGQMFDKIEQYHNPIRIQVDDTPSTSEAQALELNRETTVPTTMFHGQQSGLTRAVSM